MMNSIKEMNTAKQQTYFIFTIGPIYDTLQKATGTRSIWAASYIFSYLIKNIAGKIQAAVGEDNLVMPYTGIDPKNGAGLYPDRIIARIPNNEMFPQLKQLVKDEIAEFAKYVAGSLNEDKATVTTFMLQYLRWNCEILTLTEGENISFAAYQCLDVKELSPVIPPPGRDYMFEFLNLSTTHFLFQEGFNSSRVGFDSILEVAAKTLKNHNPTLFEKIIHEDENAIIKQFKEKFTAVFKPHQKYIAIVHADGDNISETMELIGADQSKIKRFSQFLFDFSVSATKNILKYGGMPIYMGGDDMLFFAPIAVKTNPENQIQHILNICKELNDSFQEEYNKLKEELSIVVQVPTISFSVHVSYYKFPMYEALEQSRKDLRQRAKNKKLHKNKNTIAFTLRKHSGQIISADFENDALFQILLKFIHKWINEKDPDLFLSSVATKLDILAPLLEAAVEEGVHTSHLLSKRLNEDVHSTKFEDFIEDLKAVVETFFQPNSLHKKEQLYTALRYIHFINSDKDEA